ncbi:MAG: phosphoribosylamine--glycine ligase [Victivallales bacterium]|nr:phosphoribosylamine--glycine ligase [Victivallales bacterium]
MKILVIGSGGREHTLCWKLAQSPQAEKIYCAPGNAGIATIAECVDIGVSEMEKLADFAEKKGIDLTVIGPEKPLCAGLTDVFRKRGLKVFGPDKEAAQLEGSKDFAKRFMLKYHIPTGKWATFENAAETLEYIRREFTAGAPGLVIKADGEAAGKGVCVAATADEAANFAEACFGGAFGTAGNRVLVEECLFGEEASILAFTDGRTIVPLVSSQDHKRAYDGDGGPNTGGMGAYSPAPVIDAAMMNRIKTEILDNFLTGIRREKLDFRGLVFVGVMITEAGPQVLEFNVRFGDPEVQAVLRRFEGDLPDVMLKTVNRRLNEAELRWSEEPAVCVIMTAGGYPGTYRKGDEISGLDEAAATGAIVFHAGTGLKNGKIITNGGRVLGVTARGGNIREAVEKAYQAVGRISWPDCFYRKDIGHRALARENKPGDLQ